MFNFTTGEQDVAMVTKEAYDACNSTNPILLQTTGPVNITLTSAGLHYFIGTMDRHCFLGQKLTVDVTGASGPTTSPASTPPPPPPSPVVAEPPRAPMTYVVGDALGWIVPPGGPIAYSIWARGKTFFVGDTLGMISESINLSLSLSVYISFGFVISLSTLFGTCEKK